MSSSSSATNSDSVAGLLAESFSMLSREVPEAFVRMCARLEGKAVWIEVDEERFVVEVRGGAALVRAPGGEGGEAGGDASIATSKRAICDVIDARTSLADAVIADEVRAVAPLARLVEVLGGLSMYVHGAVRCPSFPRLLERFRALSAAAAGA